MQIDRVLYPINTLGPGNRIGIWTIGCPHRCKNCSNPELWDANEEKNIDIEVLMSYLNTSLKFADGVTITGGEPFFQSDELYILLKKLRQAGIKDILVYSGFKFEVLEKKYSHILPLIDVLVDGVYIDEQNDNIGLKGSANQNVIILNDKLKDLYSTFDTNERQSQNFIYKDQIISVGIPIKY